MNTVLAFGAWLQEEPTNIEWRIIAGTCIIGIMVVFWRLARMSKKRHVQQEPEQQAGAGEHWLDDVDWQGDEHKPNND
ncbi:hypothetical protein HY624_04020 [Candidatus Uhrbacteria bacterium]|nr:hypothetical protein [Candidatus Uhrbacteria bacterium]